jgi:ketopantoate hydroxymethyltransferase
MLHHCRAVARGSKAPFLVADLPYGSYEASPEDAVKTSLRFIKEGNAEVRMMIITNHRIIYSYIIITGCETRRWG